MIEATRELLAFWKKEETLLRKNLKEDFSFDIYATAEEIQELTIEQANVKGKLSNLEECIAELENVLENTCKSENE